MGTGNCQHRQNPTAGQDLDELAVAVGHGQADFERARAALLAWKQFDIGWVETFPRHAPVAVGTSVALLIRVLGFWSLNGCRVLYSVGSPGDVARFGFAYGTLTNHAESGEALFEIHRPTDQRGHLSNPRDLLATSHARTSRPSNRAHASRTIPSSLSRSNEARNRLQRRSSMSIYVEIGTQKSRSQPHDPDRDQTRRCVGSWVGSEYAPRR
jgi:uncharacterized protein (UPF0548 family)